MPRVCQRYYIVPGQRSHSSAAVPVAVRRDTTCPAQVGMEDQRGGHATARSCADRVIEHGQHYRVRALSSMTSRQCASPTSGTDTVRQRAERTKVYVVQTARKSRRALPAHDHRPRRPRARPDLRERHDGLRRRAMGPAVDHHRHEPRGAGAGPHAPHGRALPVLPAGGFPEGGRRRREITAASPPGYRARSRRATSARASSTSASRTSRSSPSPTTRRSTRSTPDGRSSWSRCARS